jgi:hypothetical protein
MTQQAQIRAELKSHGGTGHRETFDTWDALRDWLNSPKFTAVADHVRALTVTAPHPKHAADPDKANTRHGTPMSERAA